MQAIHLKVDYTNHDRLFVQNRQHCNFILRYFYSRSLSPGLEDLLLRMLIKDPGNRITIDDMKVCFNVTIHGKYS